MDNLCYESEEPTVTALRTRMTEDMRIRNLSPNTIEAYLGHIARFARHFKRSPAELGPEAVRAYQLRVVEQGLSFSSLLQVTCALRFLYRETLGRDWAVEKIPYAKKPKRLPLVLSREEVQRLLCAIGSPQHRVLAMTMYGAGLRVSEAVGLRVEDIDSREMLIRVVQGKGREDRLVPLSRVLLKELRKHYRRCRPRGWLFPGGLPGAHISRDAVGNAIAKARPAVGSKPVTAHTLRHAYASHLLEAGVDLRTIQVLLGHACLRSTSVYLHVSKRLVGSVKSPLDELTLQS